MPALRRAPGRPRPIRPRLGSRLLRPAATSGGGGGGGAIAEDASSPAAVTGTGTTATTASFTPVANSLIVAVGNCGNNTGSGTLTAPVTDSLGSTWTLLKRANGAGAGSSEVWAMDAGATPAARTVTVTGTGGANAIGVSLAVKVLTGANPVASVLGASASVANTTAYTIALTTTTAGSLVVGGLVDVVAAGALTANGVTTAWQTVSDTAITEKYAAWRATALTTTPGAGTYGFTNTAANNQAISAVELLAAPGGGGPSTNAPAEVATGSGSALDAAADVDANAEAALGTGVASDATVSTATATNAPAEAASGTGAALDAQASATANAGLASGTGAAGDPTPAVAVNAEAATGTGSALSADNPPFVVGTPTSVTGSAVTTTALAWDAGTVAGDLLTMWVSQIGAQSISSTSLGLAQQDRVTNGSNNASLTVLTKVLDAGDIAAGTVTATFAATQVHVVTLVTVRNHNGADVLGTGSSGTATTTVAVNAATPSAPNTLVLGGVGGRAATAATDITWTWPGPLAELTEVNSGGAGNRAYLTLAQQTEIGAPAASGPDAPVPSSSVAYAAFRISILPAGAGAVTSAAAESAEGTGAALDAAVDLQVNAEAASGTGTGADPTAAVGANAAAATGTGVANDATVQTAGTTNAPAEAATGSGSAPDPSIASTVAAEAATGTGTALDGLAAVGAQAGAGTGTGTASDPQPAIAVNAEAATGTGAGLDATVSTAAVANANAEVAAGTGSAPDPAAAVGANAGAAAGTGSALDATVSIQSQTNAPAEVASGTGVAPDPAIAITIPAGVATGTGQAFDAIGQPSRDVLPGLATGTGAAFDPAIALLVFTNTATGTGAALDATGQTIAPFTVGVLTANSSTSSLTGTTTPTAVLVGSTSSGGPS